MASSDEGSTVRYQFILFVMGGTIAAQQAEAGMRELCRHLGPCDLRLVNVLREMDMAVSHKIFATPMLLVLSPRHLRILGDFTKPDAIQSVLRLIREKG